MPLPNTLHLIVLFHLDEGLRYEFRDKLDRLIDSHLWTPVLSNDVFDQISIVVNRGRAELSLAEHLWGLEGELVCHHDIEVKGFDVFVQESRLDGCGFNLDRDYSCVLVINLSSSDIVVAEFLEELDFLLNPLVLLGKFLWSWG